MAYSIFYTLFTTNNQILLDDGNEVDFNFIALKTKGYKCTLTQKESITALAMSIASTTDTALAVTGDTRNVEVFYCTHCHKSYYTKKKCWMLYPHLKQQAKTKKGHHRLSSKKRKTYKNNNKSDNPMGLITHFKMTASNNTGNLLHTQWTVNTGYSCYITYSQEHFISYKAISKSSVHIKGLGGTLCILIDKGTVKL